MKFPNSLIKYVIHTYESYQTIGDDDTTSLGSLFRQGHDNIYCRFHDGATPISLKTRDPINKSWVSPFFLFSHGRKF